MSRRGALGYLAGLLGLWAAAAMSSRPWTAGAFMTTSALKPCAQAYVVREWYGWLIVLSHYVLGGAIALTVARVPAWQAWWRREFHRWF